MHETKRTLDAIVDDRNALANDDLVIA